MQSKLLLYGFPHTLTCFLCSKDTDKQDVEVTRPEYGSCIQVFASSLSYILDASK